MPTDLVVLTAAPTVDCVSLSQAVQVLADADPRLLIPLITEASMALAQYVGRPLGRETVQELCEEQGRGLMLSRTPVLTLHKVISEGMVVTDYLIQDADQGLLVAPHGLSGGGWNSGYFGPTAEPQEGGRRMAVLYTGGYVLPGWYEPVTLPALLQQACLEMVQAWYLDPTQHTIPPMALALLRQWDYSRKERG